MNVLLSRLMMREYNIIMVIRCVVVLWIDIEINYWRYGIFKRVDLKF